MTEPRLALHAPVTGRVLALDELKGLALVMVVVLYHAAGVLSMADVLHGEVGVDIFVIASGIGLAMGAQGEGIGRYLARRFLRIYPTYWIVLTGFLLADALIRHTYFSTWDVFLHYTGMHVWFGDAHAMSVNDSFWFITLIVSLYLAFLPIRTYIDRPDIILCAGAVMACTAAAIYFHYGQAVCFAHFSLRMPGFFVGLVIGRMMKTGAVEIRPTAALGAAFLLIFYVPYAMGFIFTSPWIGGSIMAGYAFLVRPFAAAPVRKALKFLGDHSLEIFLIHQPLIREYNVLVLQRYFPGAGITTTSLCWGISVGLAVTVGLSVGLHRLLRNLPTLVPRETASAAQ
jgi:peptidoglycan/LPS O-acetylase OafA/YrhL